MTEPDHKTPNSLLTARRQELNLDIKTVADELQLSVATIRALESGDYEGLPVRVFVRGYINSYSRLLGVDPEPILETLESHGEREENKDGQPIVGNTRQLRLIRYFGTFAVAVFVVSLIFWDSFFDTKVVQKGSVSEQPPVESVAKPREEASARTDPPAVEFIEIDLQEALMATPLSSTSADDVEDQESPSFSESLISSPRDERSYEPRSTDLDSAEKASLTDVSVIPTLAVPGSDEGGLSSATKGTEVTILVRSSRRCWARIVDGAGKHLLERELPPGYERSLRGVLPFRVRLGNAEHVTLLIDGTTIRAVDYMRDSGTAKFEIFSADKIILQ